MSVNAKKPKMELVDCAEALRKVGMSTPIEMIDELIEEGVFHLNELRLVGNCNPIYISGLQNRLDHAEEVRQRIIQQNRDTFGVR